MLKPERIWAVGDKTFPTYEEARTYIATRRNVLYRETLIDVIQNAWRSEPDPVEVADDILAKFKITPRK